MKITKKQLVRIIREEAAKVTSKYDDDSALKGDQDKLPDALQKGIIDKTVEDREDDEDTSVKEMRITKRQLIRIIRESISYGELRPDWAEAGSLEDKQDEFRKRLIWYNDEWRHMDPDEDEAWNRNLDVLAKDIESMSGVPVDPMTILRSR